MAETAQIGKLVVQMLLDPTKWQEGVTQVQAGAKALVQNVSRAAAAINGVLSPAMEEVAGTSHKAGDALGDTANAGEELRDSLEKSTAATNEASEAAKKLAGVHLDANGKLRDAKGRFVEYKDALDAVKNSAGLTEDELRQLKEKVAEVDYETARKNAKGLMGGLGELASTIQDKLITAFKAAALAAGALVAASAVVGVGFEAQMKKVSTIAGATQEDMNALTDEARRLGSTTAFSATEAAQAMEVLASAGLNARQIMDATGQSLMLAGAGGTDLATSASIVASTLSQFSLEAVEAGRVADVFAKATADSQFRVEDLGEAMKYGGPVAASFGLSLEETVGIMAQFRDLGLQGSMAGTALRSVFSQASQQTKINAETLAKYNLTLNDVNPRLHKFGEILHTIGTAGISAADAMVVFGTEAGGAVATLAQQSALGSTKLGDMISSLQEAATSAGTAEKMYASMQATVAGGLAELQSAAEEVLLTLYSQYGAGLGALINQITGFVNGLAEAIGDRTDDIRQGIAAALGVLGTYIQENGSSFAEMFAEALVQAAQFSVKVAEVATMLADLLPLVDDLALLMATVWTATKVASFVSALAEGVTMLGSARLALKAFMVELTAASGGTYALVAAIGVLVAGLGALISRYVSAKDAAQQLKDAQDALSSKRQLENKTRVDEIDGVLTKQQMELANEEKALAASGELTAARKAELDLLRELTAEGAARLEAEGKLVEVGGKLRSVAALVEDANSAASDSAAQGYAAIENRVSSLRRSATEAGDTFSRLKEAIQDAKAVGDSRLSEDTIAQSLSAAAGREVQTIAQAEALLQDLQARRKEATSQANALDNERGRVVAQILNREVQDTKAAEAEKLLAVGDAASQQMREQSRYTDETRNIRFKLSQELAGFDGFLTDQIKLEMDARRREVQQSYADQIEKAKGNGAEILRLRKELEAALTDLDDLEERKRATQRAEQERERAKAIKDQRERLQAQIAAMEEKSMKESERLQREKARAIADIEDANVDLMMKIAAQYDAQIAAAREKEAADAQKAADDLVQRHKNNAQKVAAVMSKAFAGVVDAVGYAVESAYGALADLTGQVLSLFNAMTGFSFDLGSVVGDIVGAIQDAAEDGATLSIQDAVAAALQDLFSDSATFLATFAEAAPLLLAGLSAGLPDLLNAFVAALPVLVEGLAAQIPALAQVVADSIGPIVGALVSAMPAVAEALLSALDALVPAVLDALPDLVIGLVQAASAFIQELLARLPDVVRGLLDLLPGLIQGVLAELPTLIRALIAAATDLILAIVDALPDLITAILGSLPDIITALLDGLIEAIPILIEALLDGLPDIILALLEAIPPIINAVLAQIPRIITMLIGLIPDLIEGIVEMLPVLLPALVALTGDVIAGLVAATPEIAVALIAALIDLLKNLPDLAVVIGKAFVDGIKNAAEAIFDALVNIFTSVWDSITGIFGGGDKDSRSRSSSARTMQEATGSQLASLLNLTGAYRTPQVEGRQQGPERPSRPAPGSVTRGSMASVQIMLNGRVIQQALAVSDARGETTITRRGGTGGGSVGVSRGQYNKYSKNG